MTINFTNAPANTRCGRCGTVAARENGPAIHTDSKGRHYCATHTPFPIIDLTEEITIFATYAPPKVDLTKTTDACSICGRDCAPFQGRWDIDPLCTACKHDLRARDTFLPIDTLHDLRANLADTYTDTMPGVWGDSTDPATLY